MKKILSYAFVGAVALTGAMFVSCSSDDGAVENNPTFDGKTVKTQFSIALPSNVGTRMAAADVQESGNFLGIKNIKLLPFAAEPAAASTTNGSIVSLSDISALEAGNNSKVYNDVAINTETSHFLFYGQANKDDGFANGKLDKTEYSSAVSDIKFAPSPILDPSITAACGGSSKGQALITLLNAVANTTGWSAATNVKLKTFYDKFITLEAGSSEAVKETLEDLYIGLNSFSTGTEGATEADAALATAVKKAITDGGCTVDASTSVLTLPAAAQGYPEDLNLPKGAARVKWVEGAFVDNTNAENAALFNVAKLSSYAYPASLQYFVKSPLKAANETMTENGKYTQSTWEAVIAAYTAKAAAAKVSATTRSIAIVDQIQYGVARLDVNVAKLPNDLFDYDGKAVSHDNGYTLTAVIIGGQKQVDWQFKPIDSAAPFSIYDKSTVQSTITTSAASQTNYTLALENKANEPVNVALEFVNNGDDFVGKNGQIIPKGSTFYLIGQLNPQETAAGAVTQPTGKTISNVFLQDYMTLANFSFQSGKSESQLAENEKNGVGLGSATNTIPDLRTPTMELGLSVNLTWEQGLTFNVGL